jgi:hypothetical protein
MSPFGPSVDGQFEVAKINNVYLTFPVDASPLVATGLKPRIQKIQFDHDLDFPKRRSHARCAFVLPSSGVR